MNARSIVVGFVLSLSLSLACDDEGDVDPPEHGYLECTPACVTNPNGTEFCVESFDDDATLCAATCDADDDCEDPGQCTLQGVCAIACEDDAGCTSPMVCADQDSLELEAGVPLRVCMWMSQ